METPIELATPSSDTNRPEADPFVEAAAAIRALQQALAAHPAPDADVAGDPEDADDEAAGQKPRHSRWWKFW